MSSDRPRKRAVATVLVGWAVFTLTAYGQYVSKVSAYKSAVRATEGGRLASTALAEGLAGNIMIGLLLMGLVFLYVFLSSYTALDVRGGVIAGLLCLLSLGALGSMLAQFVGSDQQVTALAASDAGSHFSQWADAFSFLLWPSIAGLVAGWFAVRHKRERLEREQNRPVILTGEAREAAERDLRQREERATAAAKSRIMAEKAAAQGNSAPGGSDEITPIREAATPVPPSAPSPPAAQRVAVRCRRCGASNAPIRSECLQCGFALAE